MSRKYGQFCGLARAMEMVGERWGMLVVRDLLLGPKRFTDLRAGLPRIPSSILSARLNELEEAGVVRRRVLPQLDASVVYELTEYGAELEAVVLQLGLWGARSLGSMGEEDVFTTDSAILSLYTTFRPEIASNVRVSYELHYGPTMTLHALVDGEDLKVGEGPYPDADMTITCYGSIKPVFSKEISAAEALDQGILSISGDPALLELFADLFHIPAAPRKVEGLAVR
ncbi:helix-turn-helix domain-containing protein [Amycolatopsis sp. 195334CR]|uniref:winged helix-turn-helix transcriptional regulator n=1 Tax=Amycolatopsis sp. 195334CR TaxID=2814588 RepID=UPI001A8DFBB5|nr:helix-turn-helix domain-containing protein [Amycolatopsis sp. 195334CR]MBN6036949.1 transcriptional regulator [Amycolatopsis sp. 195334CR]